MNTWIGVGRLTRDADVRTYGENNDKKMARFTLAVDRRGKKEEGQQTADFISCVCYGKLADFADTYLRQGIKMVVRGHIQTGSYTNKDGQKVYTTDIMVDEMEFAESKRASEGSAPATGNTAQSRETAPASAPAQGRDDGFINIPDGLEEMLPFA